MVNNKGGAGLPAMEIWTIVWKGDRELGERVNTFHDWMLNSDYWTQSLAEYGVGKGKAMGVIELPDAPPAALDDSAMSPLIKANIASGLFPQPDSNTLLAA